MIVTAHWATGWAKPEHTYNFFKEGTYISGSLGFCGDDIWMIN